MARLQAKAFIPPAYDFNAPDFRKQMDDSWAAVQKEGPILSFPRGDGSAIYIVRSIKPPVLQWVDWLDGWQADPALIRGLRAKDIEARLEADKRMAALFAKKT